MKWIIENILLLSTILWCGCHFFTFGFFFFLPFGFSNDIITAYFIWSFISVLFIAYHKNKYNYQ